MAWDIATEYINTEIVTQPRHKFESYGAGALVFNSLPQDASREECLRYMPEVYVNDFISLVIPTSQEHLLHVANAVMDRIHDMFPLDDDDSTNPISEKKLLKGDGQYSTLKPSLV